VRLHSLRSRILVGSLLWTGGLLALVHILTMFAVHAFPALQGVPHHILFVVGIILAACGLLLVRNGIRQFEHLRERLGDVRKGTAPRVEGQYFTEVEPLVEDLNELLAHRERVVRRALATAGDLAHGLKTPLAILAQEVERADGAGHHELAATIRQQVDRMQRQIDYQLAQARAAGAGAATGVATPIARAAERLVHTMERLHADRALLFEQHVPHDLLLRCDAEDLDEILGNLLDNAAKWTKSRVRITATAQGTQAVIDVEDDGSGLVPEMREHVLQRGVRGDEAAPGSGLGLSIVRDLVELYGGSITLDSSALGGLRARISLPTV
jgi:signal transduction histidine kinase